MTLEKGVSRNPSETTLLARKVLETLNGRNVIALFGDLGSGKTSFTQAVGKILGVTEKIISPTFVLIREYSIRSSEFGFKNFIHADLYRLDSEKAVLGLDLGGFVLDKDNLVVIEWPEKLGSDFLEKTMKLRLKYKDENSREWEVFE